MNFSFFRSVSIALAMLSFLLFGMVKNSEGFEITSMSVENGASGCYVSLTTDEDIDLVYWYLKQESDYERVHTSTHGPGTKSVYENIGYLSGSPFGKSYTITAVAIRRVFNPLTKVPIELSRSDSYDLTVYSTPETETKVGNWTMAELYASVDVGWNGRTAEVWAEATVTNQLPEPINEGFNLFYSVVRLTPRGQHAAKIWNQPGLLWEGRVLPAYATTQMPYSKSDSLDGRANQLPEGHTYLVQGHLTVSASIGENVDNHTVSDSEKLFFSRDE